MSREGFGIQKVLHDVSVDTTKTKAFEIPAWARTSKAFIPALGTNCAVSMEVIMPEDVNATTDLLPNADTNWNTVYDASESSQIVASGTEDCWIDITEYTRGFPGGAYGRFVTASVQAADSTFKVTFRS